MTCYEKAVQLLGVRPHFRAELERKLAARGFPPAEIAAALDRLQSQGYLDDRRSAADFVTARLGRGGLGRRRLAAELARRGVGSEVAAETLAALLPDDDLPAAREAARRWSTGSARKGAAAAALARHLERKGFSRRAIVILLQEQGSGPEEPDPEAPEDT